MASLIQKILTDQDLRSSQGVSQLRNQNKALLPWND